jgi:chemotaxis regulatin CheY-phosphate phosphatase CheZ
MNTHTHDESSVQQSRNEKVLRSLHQLLYELVPLVDQIRQNLKDSTTRMPDVSKQLSSVSQATELATVEILNVLEDMTSTVTNAQVTLAAAKKNLEARIALQPRVGELIATLPHGPLTELWNEYTAIQSNAPFIEQLDHALTKTTEQTMSIAMSLQVQDITAQQIAGATHLIEQVESQLETALRHFDSPQEHNADDIQPVASGTPHLTFDSKAEYTKSSLRQEEADKITQQFLGT